MSILDVPSSLSLVRYHGKVWVQTKSKIQALMNIPPKTKNANVPRYTKPPKLVFTSYYRGVQTSTQADFGEIKQDMEQDIPSSIWRSVENSQKMHVWSFMMQLDPYTWRWIHLESALEPDCYS